MKLSPKRTLSLGEGLRSIEVLQGNVYVTLENGKRRMVHTAGEIVIRPAGGQRCMVLCPGGAWVQFGGKNIPVKVNRTIIEPGGAEPRPDGMPRTGSVPVSQIKAHPTTSLRAADHLEG